MNPQEHSDVFVRAEGVSVLDGRRKGRFAWGIEGEGIARWRCRAAIWVQAGREKQMAERGGLI
jgi:hypothetical protein